MAPKGGGGRGGGGRGGGKGGGIECSANAFSSEYSKGFIAIAAIFLAVDLLIFGLYFFKKVKRWQGYTKWWNFGIALLLDIVAKIIYVTVISLSECGRISPYDSPKVYTAAGWFEFISMILILYILILPIGQKIFSNAGQSIPKIIPTVVKWGSIGALALITILGLVAQAIFSDVNSNNDYDRSLLMRARAANQVSAAYWFLIIFLVVFMGLVTGFAVFKSSLKSGSLKFLIPVITLSFIIVSSMSLATQFNSLNYVDVEVSTALGLLAVTFIFLSVIYVTILYIASSTFLNSAAPAETAAPPPPVYAKEAPPSTQQTYGTPPPPMQNNGYPTQYQQQPQQQQQQYASQPIPQGYVAQSQSPPPQQQPQQYAYPPQTQSPPPPQQQQQYAYMPTQSPPPQQQQQQPYVHETAGVQRYEAPAAQQMGYQQPPPQQGGVEQSYRYQ